MGETHVPDAEGLQLTAQLVTPLPIASLVILAIFYKQEHLIYVGNVQSISLAVSTVTTKAIVFHVEMDISSKTQINYVTHALRHALHVKPRRLRV